MLLADGDVEDEVGTAGGEFNGIGADAVEVVVELFNLAASQADDRFQTVLMPMDGHGTARLDGVEHALGLIVRTITQIQIHPKPRRSLSLVSQIIKNSLCDYHIANKHIISNSRSSFVSSPRQGCLHTLAALHGTYSPQDGVRKRNPQNCQIAPSIFFIKWLLLFGEHTSQRTSEHLRERW